MINFEDFTKLDIRIGTIASVEKVEGADRLLRLMVDLGEEEERQIVSGIAEHFPEPEVLVGRQVPVLLNLEPRTIRGVESRGMILYVVGEEMLTTLSPGEKVENGTPVK
ncbi:Methionyl-tRNA synthetase [hydrothermal vent metagenome]|uniref:Methionine--tRNA ligase n=1 Tax=hydrothermal vent metagenome TaxID=652676 RepID=A0A3B0TB36_9ZZZZ